MKLIKGQAVKIEGRKGDHTFQQWKMSKVVGLLAVMLDRDQKTVTVAAGRVKPASGRAKIEIPAAVSVEAVETEKVQTPKKSKKASPKATQDPDMGPDKKPSPFIETLKSDGRVAEIIPDKGKWPAATLRKRMQRLIAQAGLTATVAKDGNEMVATLAKSKRKAV